MTFNLAGLLLFQILDLHIPYLDLLLADGVVPAGVVVGGVLLPGNQLGRMEQLAIGACPHLKQKTYHLLDQLICVTSSTTVGSRSTKTALGTCLPEPVVEKKVE